MKPKIYIETSVISYYASVPSRDLIVAANQQITLEWWQFNLPGFDAYISEIVFDEASAGDPVSARKRLDIIRDFPLLELKQEIIVLAQLFLSKGILPEKALRDAFHISIASIHGMDYLVTWNCKHIANASIRRGIETVCHQEGYEIPVICTPQELMGE